jgi:hypothetical protein
MLAEEPVPPAGSGSVPRAGDVDADIASLFTASPQVVTAEQPDAGHNLSVGLSAMAYHLKVLSFAEECALAREYFDSAPRTRANPGPTPLTRGRPDSIPLAGG